MYHYLVLMSGFMILAGISAGQDLPNLETEKLSKPEIVKRVSSVKEGDWLLEITANQPFIAGESVKINLRIKNTGKDERNLVISRGIHGYALHAVLVDGKEVGLTAYGNAVFHGRFEHSILNKMIPPEGYWDEEINVSRVFDMSLTGEYQFSLKREYGQIGTNEYKIIEFPDFVLELKSPDSPAFDENPFEIEDAHRLDKIKERIERDRDMD